MSEQPVERRDERSGTEPERTQVWASSGEAAQFPPEDTQHSGRDDQHDGDQHGDHERGEEKRRAESESRSGD